MKNDEQLMVEYSNGNTEVLDEIFLRYKKKMFNYALRMLGNRADAEDVAAELFYVLLRKKDAYQPTHKFSTWFYTVAHNICMSRLRLRKRTVSMWFKREKEADGFEQWDVQDLAPSPGETAQSRDVALYVKGAIGKLPLVEKEALILREYQHLPYVEIAGILGCKQAKVRAMLYRARQKLKEKLRFIVAEADNV